MKLIIEVDLDNDALVFEFGTETLVEAMEVGVMLMKVSNWVFDHPVLTPKEHPILDSNGNKVGRARIVDTSKED